MEADMGDEPGPSGPNAKEKAIGNLETRIEWCEP